jgi:alpha-L-fucosidase
MKWWTDARFGMFIHWGLYALPARHEWVKNIERMTNEQYQKYFETFNPDMYDPHEWAKMAKAAGMKYVVLTAKHHEGFCLFDSKFTDYKATNTPYGKDLIPCRGTEGRILLFPHRLASSGLYNRQEPSAKTGIRQCLCTPE